ncbi:hypothetical protein F4818DRAFT_61165 [Hypoxylon cercidicola]|nr:hypothetical protein F4818DRAFT_61165 [Hypoxylon cercidicola]
MPRRRYRPSQHYHRHCHSYQPSICCRPTQHDQARQFWWRFDVYSNGECDTQFAAPAVDTDTSADALGVGRGILYRAEGTEAEGSETQDDETEFAPLLGQGRIRGSQGFWVVFLDGMRWYPGALEGAALLTFGSDTRRVPSFINRQGIPLRNMLQPEVSTEPLFSFIPRDRPASDNDLASYLVHDEPEVCIRDHQDGIMVVPNGRLMIWIIGSRNDVPWHYFNRLRQRAGRINIPDALENHLNAEFPETIRQVVREIAGDV